jgi:hypothetical protein
MKFLAVVWVLLALAEVGFSLDREAFTFTKYDLNVQLEPEQQRLAARGTVTLRNDSSSPQKIAVLQISSSLTWRSIQAEGKPLQFVSQPYESDIDHTGELSEAIVTLPKEVPPGGSVELEIGYEGVIVLDATRLTRIGVPKETAIHSDWDQISVASSAVRGVGNVAWYPVAMESANLSEGNSVFETLGRWRAKSAASTMQVGLCVEVLSTEVGRWSLLMNNIQRGDAGGGGIGGSDHDPHVSVCGWQAFQPLGQIVPTFAVAPYEQIATGGLAIYFLPIRKSEAQAFVQAAERVRGFVTEWLGAPRSQVRVVELADAGTSPYEAGTILLTPLNDTDPQLLQIVMVHELAHAAFASPRLWISEGSAHFLQAAYREQQSGRASALDFMGLHRAAMADAERAATAAGKGDSSKGMTESGESPAARPSDAGANSLVSTTVDEFARSKAAYVWWMLRDMVGEDSLKKTLANYHPEQDKDAVYMQHLVEAQAKRDLQWFFDDWVYHDRGLPDFRVESAFARKASQDNYLVTITVENLGAAGAEVPVTVDFDGGETTQRVEVPGNAKGTIRVATPKPPTQVVVNDGSVPESDMSNNVFKVERSNQ